MFASQIKTLVLLYLYKLHHAHPPIPNLSTDLLKAAQQLRLNSELIITSADKGGHVVVLLAVHYAELCSVHLEDAAYIRVDAFGSGRFCIPMVDPHTHLDREIFNISFTTPDLTDRLLKLQCSQLLNLLKKLVISHDLDAKDLHRLCPHQPYLGIIPRFYTLPKLHKLGRLTIRPIITNCGLYCDESVLHMKTILNLLPTFSTSVMHSYQLAKILDDFEFPNMAFLVSFDVKSLFTRVPIAETIKIVDRRLVRLQLLHPELLKETTSLTVNGIIKLLSFLLHDCYFVWSGCLYRQCDGLPMGGRLSPVLARIFMEDLEETALAACLMAPLLYKQYVDDIVVVWNLLLGPYTVLLDLLNEQHGDIVLMAEEERHGSLPFLDLMITRPDTSVGHPYSLAMYRKDTHSHRYLHFLSSNPFSQKHSLFCSLLIRAHHLLKNHPASLTFELRYLRRTFTLAHNGYPDAVIHKWFNTFQRELILNPSVLDLPAPKQVSWLTDQSDLVDSSALDPVLDLNPQPVLADMDMDLDPTDQNQVLDLNEPQVDLLPTISVRVPWMPTVFAPYIPDFSERL